MAFLSLAGILQTKLSIDWKICAFPPVYIDGLNFCQACVDSLTKVCEKKKRKTNIDLFIYYSAPLDLHLITLQAQKTTINLHPKSFFLFSIVGNSVWWSTQFFNAGNSGRKVAVLF